METSLKTGFAQIFSWCPKNLSCPKFGGGAAPLAPPPRPVRLCVRQVKKFSMDTNFGHFIVHWSIAALKVFKQNQSTNFGLIAVFVKVASEITKKKLSIAFDWFTCFHDFSKSRKSTLFAGCRVYKAYLQNERVWKLFGSIQKVANLSALRPAFSSCMIYTLFVENQRYLEIPLIDFCKTSLKRRQSPKGYVA